MEIYCNEKLVTKNVTLCDTYFSKIKGLMFTKKIKPILMAFNIEHVIGIHMFFVFKPINAFWLNKSLEIVFMKKNLKPFTPLILPTEQAKYVLELPISQGKDLRIGNKLVFK